MNIIFEFEFPGSIFVVLKKSFICSCHVFNSVSLPYILFFDVSYLILVSNLTIIRIISQNLFGTNNNLAVAIKTTGILVLFVISQYRVDISRLMTSFSA